MEPELQSMPPAEPIVPIPLAPLSVTFRKHAPDEEILHFVRRCADRLKHGAQGVLEVYVERRADVHEIRLLAQDGSGRSIVEADPDVYLAVRNAFGRLEG